MSNEQQKTCSQCGAPIDGITSNCKYCGAELSVVPAQAQTQYVPQQTPPQIPVQQQYSQPAIQNEPPVNTGTSRYSSKSKTVAGLLAIFLGGFGIHKFYLGKIGMGILYLVFFWTYIPGIIAFIEGIIYLTSSDEKFYQKYVVKK